MGQTKIDILRKAKLFKGSGIFVNEDLTKLNAEVLASVSLKQSSAVEKNRGLLKSKYSRYSRETNTLRK
ncbi:hypothetical protein DPMN_098403 [Dreissena polymorpha]|uniref:Uncharacterized protein n=1 Tax=Dreissena polymorpha TaxID=45954 RepID=A0A9D4LC97_DREPO|nr:hypothetical protein DPMN_098403 [Dreissena polymorpha]